MRHSITVFICLFLFSCSSSENETDPTPVQPSSREYTLTVSSGAGGTVSTSGGTYEEGSTVNISATPNSEYIFQNWSNGSTDNPLTVTVNQNITLTANFIKRKYPLTINIQGEGTVREEIVSSSKSTPTEYNSGAVVRLTADPTGNWVFEEWTGSVTETTSQITITLDEPKTVNVRFMRYFNYNQPSYFLFKSDFRIEPTLLARNAGNEIDGNLNCYSTSLGYVDFNFDGYYDVIYAKCNNTVERHPIEIYLNTGDNENFIFQTDIITNNIGGEAVRKSLVGDFNLDSKPDVFFVDSGAEPGYFDGIAGQGAKQSILLSNENGYQFNIIEEHPKEFVHGACSGDFDNDGDLDIFTSQGFFLVNDGRANFTLDDHLAPFIFQIYTTEMIDLNNDGFLDIICSGHHFGTNPLDYMVGPTIFFGNGSDYEISNSLILDDIDDWDTVIDIDIVDLNNDGFGEIILNRTGGGENNEIFYRGWRIQIFENINGSEFIDRTEEFMDIYENRNGQWIVWLRIEDIDNDGEIELFDDDPTNQGSGEDLIWDWNGSQFIKRF